MNDLKTKLRENFWPISAILFCPCHLPLSMGLLVSITAGTTFGAYLASHYASLEASMAVIFSLYFVVAFLIWAVRGPQASKGEACAFDEHGNPVRAGLSTKQIIMWGLVTALAMPLLITASLFVRQDLIGQIVAGMQGMDLSNSGFIWLISISTIVMIPVMLVWIIWMWVTWSKAENKDAKQEHWNYEYE